jgi:putative transcriptional regulator
MSAAPDMDMLLLDYASGALPEGPALAVAASLSLDPLARARYRVMEDAGGMLLADLEPAPLSNRLLTDTLRRLDRTDEAHEPSLPDAETRRLLPPPLWRYVPDGLAGLRWTRWGGSVQEAVLQLADTGHRAMLLRIKAGHGVLQHDHAGMEYTVVLSGSFSDETGHYAPGSLQLCDGSITHTPVADPDQDCVCLGVLSAPIRVTGLMGRLVNPFLKF